MKKLLAKTFLYLLIILLIPSLYFIWQAKQAVDTFLLVHNLEVEVKYDWLFVDHKGEIYLYDVKVYKDQRDPLFTAEFIKISTMGIFDLINAQEHILHNEFPREIGVSIINGISEQSALLPSTLGLNYDPETLLSFYPAACASSLNKDVPLLKFNAASHFTIHRTADISEVNFDFNSLEFASINGKFKINNFSEGRTDGSFVSDLSLDFSKITWLQQNTQKCLAELNMGKEQFTSILSQQLVTNATQYELVLDSDFPSELAEFLYIPQEIKLSFDLEEGKKFEQVSFEPVYELPEKLGLSLFLNNKPINVIFDQSASITAAEEPVVETLVIADKTIVKKDSSILNRNDLNKHIGSKLLISFKSGKTVEGYLHSYNTRSLKILQRKFKGKSILPFEFKDIDQMVLLRAEN